MGGKGQSCWSTFRPRAKARCTCGAINGAPARVLKGCFKVSKKNNLEASTRNRDARSKRYPKVEGDFQAPARNGLRRCRVLEPPEVERPLQPGVMRTPGRPRRAGQPDRARLTRTRAKLSRDESGRQLSGTDRGRAAGRQRRGG